MILRPYQRAAIDAVYDWFQEHPGNPLVVIPTGGGKSLVMAEMIREILAGSPSERIVIVTHVRELISQNFKELISVYPSAPAGIYSAGIGLRQIQSQVLFAGIQSIHRRAYDLQGVDLVLIDEAHLIPRKADTMYRRFLDDLLQINPYLKIIGFTATPYRLDSGRLDRGDEAMFDGIAYEISVRELIEQGYLAQLTTKRTHTHLDTAGVAKRGGEFVPGALEKAVDQTVLTKAAVNEIIAAGANRSSWLVFGSGVSHCRHIAEAIHEHGIEAQCIFGDTPKGERDELIKRFRARSLRCLVSMGVLTTGFNAPNVDLLALLRPTESAGLYVQMVGRASRLADGKSDALILDFARNIERHGPVDAISPREPGKGDGEAPIKVCPECFEYVPISVMTCPACGHEFPPPPPEPKITGKAAEAPILSDRVPQWVPVATVSYHRHVKVGSPDSMRVEYQAGLLTYREWVCFEHQGYPRDKAIRWWRARAPAMPVPSTITEALEHSRALAAPREIAVRKAGKYWEVVGARL